MPLSDLARAIPGVVVFGLLPGLALATLLAPRWSGWLRLAAAPGLSAGLVGVLGLVAHDVHVPVRAWWVGLVTFVLLVAAGWRWRTSRGRSSDRARSRQRSRDSAGMAALPYAVALVCGVILVGTIAAAMRDEPLPLDADPAVHAAVAERIAASGDILPVIPVPVDHSASVRPRAGAEAVAALASTAGGPSPTGTLLPEALLAVLLAPLSLTLLALEVTGSRTVAALASVLAAGFPYPSLPVVFGEVPLIVEGTLIVPLVIGAVRVLRDTDIRQNLAMVGVCVAAIWATHGTEVLTAAAIAVPLGLLLLLEGVPWRIWTRRAATLVVACAAAALLVTVVTRLPAVPSGVPVIGSGPEVPEATTLGGGTRLVDFPRQFLDFVLPARLLLVPYVLGLVAGWKLRPLRGLLLAHLALAAILADVTTKRFLRPVWERVFPWSATDRLASVQYRVLPILLAAGLVFAATALAPELRRRRPALKTSLGSSAAFAGVVVAAIALGIGHDHDARFYTSARFTVGMVSASDLVVMREMAAKLPRGTPVMAHGIDDAGQWVIALTPDELYLSKDFVISHPNDARFRAIGDACFDPQAARAALAGAGAVFVGSRERAGTKYPWDAQCVARIPGLRLIASADDGRRTSAAFAVVP